MLLQLQFNCIHTLCDGTQRSDRIPKRNDCLSRELGDSSHPERVRQILGENHILAITFPAHTMSFFQAFDLVFFGVLHKLKASATGEFHDDSVNA
jgi:hypothetical protein